MHLWQVMYFSVFLHYVLQMHLLAGLTHLLLQGYSQLDAGCLGLKLQTDCFWPPIFRIIRLQQWNRWFRYRLCFFFITSFRCSLGFCVLLFWKRKIFCVSYMWIHVLMCVIIVKMKFWTVPVTSPKTSLRKRLWPSAIVFSSNTEQLQKRKKVVNQQALMIKQVTDKKWSIELFLGTTSLNIVIGNPETVVESWVSPWWRSYMITYWTSNLYHSQNAQKLKVLPTSLMWSSITPEEMRMFLGPIILMRQLRKENIGDCWSTDTTISTPIFTHAMSRNCFESIWQAWHFSDSSQQTQVSGSLFNILPMYEYFYRNLGQFTAQNRNCHLMKPWCHGRIAWNLDIQSTQNNEVCSTGENDVWGGIGVISVTCWGKEVGGYSVITFRNKLSPKSSHLSK